MGSLKIRYSPEAVDVKPILKGVITYIPGLSQLVLNRGAGGTHSAEYCYGIWLKHLSLLWKHGLFCLPEAVAELGPGASIGVRLAALLCGVNTYYALDVVRYTEPARNLAILDDLIRVMSHQIDFASHGSARKWNGHWVHSETMWKILVGKMPYLINRQPWSTHQAFLNKYGFEILFQLQQHRTDGILREHLAPRWQTLSDDDLTCSAAYFIARKRIREEHA